MKNGAILFLTLALTSGSVLASHPSTFWKPLNAYTAAKEANDTAGIIKYAEEMIAIMEKEPESQAKIDVLGARYDELARLYEAQGNYTKASMYYEKYIPYGEKKGWVDGVNFAKQKLVILQSRLEVYKATTEVTAPFYGAKFEPQKGVLYGAVYDKDPDIGVAYTNEAIRSKYTSDESLLLAYLEFGDTIENLRFKFKLAKEQDKAIVLAWNTYASSLQAITAQGNIKNLEAYVDATLDYIEAQGVPVFLRFANEMNVGENGDDKDAYIEGFRYIATKAKAKANIAVVWAPNDVGATNRPFVDYYPGDAYVDWIGLSMYPVQYFGGKEDTNARTKENNDTFFLAGDNANPLLRVAPVIAFMEANQINKPLMITECGMHHTVNTLNKETTAWGNYQLQKTYSELVRLYPQIKGICYFNTIVAGTPNEYALFTNETLLATYNRYVADEIFIKAIGKESSISYTALTDKQVISRAEGAVTLTASAYYPFINGPGRISVEYRVGGKWIAAPSTPPYTVTLSEEQLALGDELKITIVVDGVAKVSKTLKIQ